MSRLLPAVSELRKVAAMPPPGDSPRWWQRFEDRLLAWRDARVADPGFRHRAAGSWWGGWMARRRASALFDLVAGFVYSQVLLACVRLRVFDRLASGPQSVEALAPQLGLEPEAARRLVAAAVSLKLLQPRRGGRVGLGPLGAPMVGNAAVAAMVEHHAALYGDLRDPVALLRGEAEPALASYWPYATGSEGAGAMSAERVAAYSALMSASQSIVIDEVLAAYDLGAHRCLLDVGGGEGRFVAAAGRSAPQLQLMLFDLPPVIERAAQQPETRALGARLRLMPGDFFAEPLPAGADVISLIRVLFDHPDERVESLLRAVHAALPAGGRLLVAEPMSATPGAEAMGDAYFGFYLLAMGQGRPRSADEIERLLRGAGFGAVRRLRARLPLHAQVLVATAAPPRRSDRTSM